MTRLYLLLFTALLGAAPAAAAPLLIPGLNHIPLAVHDLDQAGGEYVRHLRAGDGLASPTDSAGLLHSLLPAARCTSPAPRSPWSRNWPKAKSSSCPPSAS
ncbi:hypothetical protein ACHMW6_34390 [Pseudoduganella sp. UC29_106]|uniref:hypothetical protein n=1 Tax=Pseudoduganella sp. UC29_106 TaxID=3374553 RepID=UPI003756F78B